MGGDRGPNEKFEFPDRDADHVIQYSTRTDQALLYRLNGDRNPLHSDPSFAALGGFPNPFCMDYAHMDLQGERYFTQSATANLNCSARWPVDLALR